MRIIKRHTLTKPANNYVIDAPQPSNISYWWNMGSLLGLSLGIQIITGVTLAMHYNPNVLEAFNSVEHIMRDVNNGWLIRYLHANTASAFFFLVYLHIGRGLYYGSYKSPRTLTWILGTIMLIIMMGTAFLGYVLPYGATVITNLMSAIPWMGQDIVEFIWGGFSVNNATLNRFFSLHFVLPFVLAALALMHLIALHDTAGANNPLGVSGNYDRVPFAPYFVFKDIITIFLFMWVLSLFVFFIPNALGDSENYVMANPMQTPPAIVPEWYLLPFYAILRSIPNKLVGVIAMFSAILSILTLTIGDVSKLRGLQFKPFNKGLFFFFIGNLLLLLVLGAKHVESPFIEAGQIATLIYFVYFGVIVPLNTTLENSINELYIFVKNIFSSLKTKINTINYASIEDKTPLHSFAFTRVNSIFLGLTPIETMYSRAKRYEYLQWYPEEASTLPTWKQMYKQMEIDMGVQEAKHLHQLSYYSSEFIGPMGVDLRTILFNAKQKIFVPFKGIILIVNRDAPNQNTFNAHYVSKRQLELKGLGVLASTVDAISQNNVAKGNTSKFSNIKSNINNLIMFIIGIISFSYLSNQIINNKLTTNYCDAPTPWGLYFQDTASPQMEALAELHDNIMFYLVIILFAVGWILAAACVKYFKSAISNKFVSHGSLVEIIWTISPGIILIFIAFTSFKLLYLMDEVSDVNMSLYIEGHQWYWSYQYPDFLDTDGEFIEYDSYLIPESDLEPGAIRMLDVDERVIIPELTHVRFIVSSGDVIHCYACPSLGIKADAYPGRLNQASALINRLGTFYGQCSEICGILHSSMPIAIESVTLEKFLLFLWEK